MNIIRWGSITGSKTFLWAGIHSIFLVCSGLFVGGSIIDNRFQDFSLGWHLQPIHSIFRVCSGCQSSQPDDLSDLSCNQFYGTLHPLPDIAILSIKATILSNQGHHETNQNLGFLLTDPTQFLLLINFLTKLTFR